MDSPVTVFGGTGFLGRAIVEGLSRAGQSVRVAVRHPNDKLFLESNSKIEQVRADVRDEMSIVAAVDGVAGVVNAVSLYMERGDDTFQTIHVEGAEQVASCANKVGAKLVHISGIGADLYSQSNYVKARAQGEQRVHMAKPDAVILCPSVLFGPDDAFLRTLASLVQYLPVIPLFGNGMTRLAPVYVEDVARAVTRVLIRPEAKGKIYELGGPDVYTYRELLTMVMHHLGRKRLLVPVPFSVWDGLATLLSVLPSPPVTRDQLALMKQDNITGPNANNFADLGVQPHSLQDLLPQCVPT